MYSEFHFENENPFFSDHDFLDYLSYIKITENNPLLQEEKTSQDFALKDSPIFFPLEKILEVLNLSKNEEFKNKIKSVFNRNKDLSNENIKNYCIEETNEYNYMKLLKRKKGRSDCIEANYLENYNINKDKKRGREKTRLFNNRRKIHNKYTADNIIKSLKSKYYKNGIKFLNGIIGLDKNEELLNLNYSKYVNNLKRDINLEYLKMPLWKFYSMDISDKYIINSKKNIYNGFHNNFIENNHNKKILEKIKENNKDTTLNFALDMTFSNFIDLFTGKIEVRDLIKDEKEIDCSKIEKFINGKEEIIMKNDNQGDTIYFQKYIFYMYNYERWFYIKTPRKKKGKKELKESKLSTNNISTI